MPFTLSGIFSDSFPALRYSRYLSSKNPVIGIKMIRKKTKLYIEKQAITKKRSRAPV